ncbi:MAG: beta-ketoacyl-ACP synthase III [Waddliaceae bacterium]
MKAKIIATGSYLPEKVLSNEDLEKIVDTNDEWIVSRTGMKERRIARIDETPSEMGVIASERALAEAGISSEQIEMILVGTSTPDYIMPSTASLIQAKLKCKNAAAVDLMAACSGFLYALSAAKAYVESGAYTNVLVVATEKMSAFLDYQDRSTCVLFGDGAAACVVSNKGAGLSIKHVDLGCDGTLYELIQIPAGGSKNPTSHETLDNRLQYFKMQGKEVFRHAVRRMDAAGKRCLEKANLKVQDLEWLVPHQANIRIMDALANASKMPLEKIYKTIHKYGNTSAASIAISLDELLKDHKIEEGHHLLLLTFGAGLTWGAALLTKEGE